MQLPQLGRVVGTVLHNRAYSEHGRLLFGATTSRKLFVRSRCIVVEFTASRKILEKFAALHSSRVKKKSRIIQASMASTSNIVLLMSPVCHLEILNYEH